MKFLHVGRYGALCFWCCEKLKPPSLILVGEHFAHFFDEALDFV